jgi:septum formation protein
LRAAGIEFDVVVANLDESVLDGETAPQHVRRLAETKARAVAERAGTHPVLAADTVVVVDGTILGKPADERDAKRMLRLLSGRNHEVVTGVYLLHRTGVESIVEVSTVVFAPLTDAEIDWYVVSGEPFDKAGAYAIQGLASRFVTRIEGSYSNVVGLPVAQVYGLCARAGLLVS